MRKLNRKVEKAKLKYAKQHGFHLTDFGVEAENRAMRKSSRADAKAFAWKNAMNKEFSTTNLSSLERKYINKGEQHLKKRNISTSSSMQSFYEVRSSKNCAKSRAAADLRERLTNQ